MFWSHAVIGLEVSTAPSAFVFRKARIAVTIQKGSVKGSFPAISVALVAATGMASVIWAIWLECVIPL